MENKEEKMVQSISCPHCGNSFMGSAVPYCYESKTIQKEVAKYSKQGCKIELVKAKDFKLEFCECIEIK